MVLTQQESQSKTSGASTSDWIEQVKGQVIYAYDISALISEGKRTLPASETWLFNNHEAMESIQRGLKDAKEGRISKINLNEL